MELLLVLALLACPVGMGAMMWWMGRNMNNDQNKNDQAEQPAAPENAEQPAAPEDAELLRDEHARLTAQIDQLERAEQTGARTR